MGTGSKTRARGSGAVPGILVENWEVGAIFEKTVQRSEGKSLPRLDDELRRRWRLGIRPGLERIRAVFAALGPGAGATRALIAGTNGKGSTATFLDAVLRAHGVRTGLFTSPHLVSAAERIRLDGVPVDDAHLAPGMAAVAAAETAAGVTLTGFEWVTAVAAAIFGRAAPECWVLEVGLGGRLDATNAWEPDLSIITPIGLDHTALLGDDLGSIATEKAGILRGGRPAILAAQAPAAAAALEVAADRIGAGPVLRDGHDWRWTLSGGRLRWEAADGLVVGPVFPGLAGLHQGGNAATALAAAARLLPGLTGAPMEPALAGQGLAAARMNGRFQLVRVGPRRVLVDVAHNPHGAAALAASYRDRWGVCPAALVALKDDKDARGVLEPLGALAERLLLCPLPGEPHHPPQALAAACSGPASAVAVPSWEAGLEGLPVVAPGAPPPLICGSHFLVGAVLSVID